MSIDLKDIDNLGIDRVLQRGTGEIILQDETAILVKDTVSGALMLACDESFRDISSLDRYLGEGCDLLMVSDYNIGKSAFERYGFEKKLECYQCAYYGGIPALDARLTVREADKDDIPLLMANYDGISEEEMEENIERQNVFFGYDRDQMVGFMGEHLEGSLGILYIFPEYRRKGYAEALEKYLFARTMKQGYIPFGQVIKGNEASLRLQKKLGLTQSDKLIWWMWNE